MVNFVNSFLSYLAVMAVIVVVAGIAITIGITLRKSKNKNSGGDAAWQNQKDKN